MGAASRHFQGATVKRRACEVKGNEGFRKENELDCWASLYITMQLLPLQFVVVSRSKERPS